MKGYKSWKALKRQLEELLCADLKGHITYFLTRYHNVHDSYGRAAILFDNRELVCFSWIEMYKQESDMSQLYEQTGEYGGKDLEQKWDENCTYYDMDFLDAALKFTDMPIQEALQSENSVIRILALMDRRVGKRTLQKLQAAPPVLPDWAEKFYELRIEASKK